jgi:hypothetical protein
MTTVFVSHPQSKLAHYFGDRAIAALMAVADVRFNPGDTDLSSSELAALAGDCEVIISYRQTVGDEALFAALPRLLAFVRCAIDIRNIDVPAASRHGVLVTQASAGFIPSVSEWIIGVMIDLSRHISATTADYHAGRPVTPTMGRELRGATLGVIGYRPDQPLPLRRGAGAGHAHRGARPLHAHRPQGAGAGRAAAAAAALRLRGLPGRRDRGHREHDERRRPLRP